MPHAATKRSVRIEVDRDQPPIRLAVEVWNEICAHAREAAAPPHEEECCGLLLGDAAVRYRLVHRCQNVATVRHQADPEHYPRDSRTGFVMNEADYAEAQRLAEASQLGVTAVYHSHVDFDLYLSDLDLECIEQPYFPFPAADQIVVSVLHGQVREGGVFRRQPGGGFGGYILEPGDGSERAS